MSEPDAASSKGAQFMMRLLSSAFDCQGCSEAGRALTPKARDAMEAGFDIIQLDNSVFVAPSAVAKSDFCFGSENETALAVGRCVTASILSERSRQAVGSA